MVGQKGGQEMITCFVCHNKAVVNIQRINSMAKPVPVCWTHVIQIAEANSKEDKKTKKYSRFEEKKETKRKWREEQ